MYHKKKFSVEIIYEEKKKRGGQKEIRQKPGRGKKKESPFFLSSLPCRLEHQKVFFSSLRLFFSIRMVNSIMSFSVVLRFTKEEILMCACLDETLLS
jgi:hypothetical protein